VTYQFNSKDDIMKTKTLTSLVLAGMIGMVGMSAASCAFAQSNTAPTANAPAAVLTQTSTSQDGAWAPPYGQPVQGKTRAQVYQELVHAQQDGQLAYLNSTIYAHH
jgi:hypothetical protein